MKSIVIYDSQFGNTEKIAREIAAALQTRAVPAAELISTDLDNIELLVVGSPTQRLTATPTLTGWIDSLPSGSLAGMHGTAFDTRFTQEHINSIKVLPFFVRIFGYAAGPIARRLRKKGAKIIAEPKGFFVRDTEGPLLAGENERARIWAEQLLKSASAGNQSPAH
jgi:flavodoxin